MQCPPRAPRGHYSDNAALAFSPSGKRLAFSTWTEASLWDTESGGKLLSTDLPVGLGDALCFVDEERLLLLRVETAKDRNERGDEFWPEDQPRFCRVRDLLSADPAKVLTEIPDFKHVFNDVMSSNGKYFIVDGLVETLEGRSHLIKCYKPGSAKAIWGIRSKDKGNSDVVIDGGNQYLAARPDVNAESSLLQLSSGTLVRNLHNRVAHLAPGAALYIVSNPSTSQGRGCRVFTGGAKEIPAVTVGIDWETGSAQFSPNGETIAWGNADGTVTLCDLKQVREHLQQIGLSWPSE